MLITISILGINAVTKQIKDTKLGVYIFSDISECANIQKDMPTDTNVQIYNTPTYDVKLKKLEYSEFYAAKYSTKDLTFEIYAYEFKDIETAQKYFYNVTGQKDMNPNYSESYGTFGTYNCAVIDDEKVYRIKSNSKSSTAVKELLSTKFTIKLW